MSNSNFEKLEEKISDHITRLRGALNNYRRQAIKDKHTTEKVQSLLQKIRSVETETEVTKAVVEAGIKSDSLTGLPNQTAYEERALSELKRFKRYHRSLVIAVCEIDAYGEIEEKFGAQAAAKALKLIGKVVANKIRSVDFIARHKSDQFIFLMPETKGEQALKVLNKVRRSVGSIPFRFKDEPLKITLSIGVTQFVGNDSVEVAFARALRALDQAKIQGRNRCSLELKVPKGHGIKNKKNSVGGLSAEISFR